MNLLRLLCSFLFQLKFSSVVVHEHGIYVSFIRELIFGNIHLSILCNAPFSPTSLSCDHAVSTSFRLFCGECILK